VPSTIDILAINICNTEMWGPGHGFALQNQSLFHEGILGRSADARDLEKSICLDPIPTPAANGDELFT